MSMEFLIQQMKHRAEGHLRLTFILMNIHEHGVPHSANDNIVLKVISDWPLF